MSYRRIPPRFPRLPLFGLGCLAAILLGLGSALAAHLGQDFDSYFPLVLKSWPAPGRLLISEVVYNPAGTGTEEEWIEIYNAGSRPLDLSAYKIGDEETPGQQEGMLQFPNGASIAPGQALVIAYRATSFAARFGLHPDFEMRESDPGVVNMLKYTAWAGGNIELVNTGDEVLVLDCEDHQVDALSWGSSTYAFDPPSAKVAGGHSLERRPANSDTDTALDWVDQPEPQPWVVDLSPSTPTPNITPSLSATVASTSAVESTGTPSGPGNWLLSEVYYDPPGPTEPGGEWIEILNAGSIPACLDGYRLGDEETPGQGEGMALFPSGSCLAGGQVVVVANQATTFRLAYNANPQYELSDSDPAVPDMLHDQDWAPGSVALSNSGDEVLLLDPSYTLLDALSWGSSAWAFDPAVPKVAEGHSLERRPVQTDTDTASDWLDQAQPNPGSMDLVLPSPTPISGITPTLTPTSRPTALNTPTSTLLKTPTRTPTPARTPTNTSTSALLKTATPTRTKTPSPTPSRTASPTATSPSTGHLLLSEIFYDTPGTDSLEEWIEIYNPTTAAVNLSLYKVGDEETQGGTEGMFRFPDGAVLGPGKKVVVAANSAGFYALYGFEPDYEIMDADSAVPNMVEYTAWGYGDFSLNNAADEVLLLNASDAVVDAVTYASGVFSGVIPHPGVATGHSIERWPAGQDTDDCSYDFVDRYPPSPGA